MPGAWVHLQVKEWRLDGAARVLAVKPCPQIKQGPGRVVLMKSTTLYRGEMATVKFTGSPEQITGTWGHPVYSLDRGAQGEYVPLGDLKPGERVRTADGWATVESLARSWTDGQLVYNIEVETDHRYLVGELRVDCHNGGPQCGQNGSVPPEGTNNRGPKLGAEQGRENRTDWLATNEFDPNQPAHVRGWLQNERRMVEQGRASQPRTPPGYVMAHGRNTPAREGYDYSNARLQGEDLNKLEESTRKKFQSKNK